VRWKIFTLSNDFLIRKAGILDAVAMALATAALQTMLNFSVTRQS